MSTAVRFTSADLEGFPDDGKRREIIDGELVVSSQPHYYHQLLSGDLVTALALWSRPRGAGQATSSSGLRISPEEDVAPDVVWTSTARLPHILSGGKLYTAPELVIEILSPGRRNITRDREAKRKLYSRHGVRGYWIVDWVARSIEVYRRSGDHLTLVATFPTGDTLTSPLLPEFALSLAEFFSPIPAGATYADDGE